MSLALPDAERLLSITFDADTTTELPDDIEVAISSARLGDAPLDLSSWVPTTWRGSIGTIEPAAQADGAVAPVEDDHDIRAARDQQGGGVVVGRGGGGRLPERLDRGAGAPGRARFSLPQRLRPRQTRHPG